MRRRKNARCNADLKKKRTARNPNMCAFAARSYTFSAPLSTPTLVVTRLHRKRQIVFIHGERIIRPTPGSTAKTLPATAGTAAVVCALIGAASTSEARRRAMRWSELAAGATRQPAKRGVRGPA